MKTNFTTKKNRLENSHAKKSLANDCLLASSFCYFLSQKSYHVHKQHQREWDELNFFVDFTFTNDESSMSTVSDMMDEIQGKIAVLFETLFLSLTSLNFCWINLLFCKTLNDFPSQSF